MAAAFGLVLALIVGLAQKSDAQALNIVLVTDDPKELDAVGLNCTVANFTSVSTVNFTQTWQGEVIRLIPKQVDVHASTLRVVDFTLQDAGTYGCQVGSVKSTESIDLSEKVAMAPRLMSAAHDVVYAEVDIKTTLRATFLNLSTLSVFKWSKDGEELKPVSKEEVAIGYRMHGTPVEVSGSRLFRTLTTSSSDFGYHYVTACTRGGCTSAVIELRRTARPESPLQFQVVDNFTAGFWFTWRSGFNGGGDQRFELSYKRADSTRGWVYAKVDEDPGVGHIVYAHISGLVLNTGYDVRVQAINKRNALLTSNFTEELFVFVKGPATSSDIGVGAGIGIGITVALLLAAGVCLAGYYVWRAKWTNDPRLTDAECRSNITLSAQSSTKSEPPRKDSNSDNGTEKTASPFSPSLPRPSMPRPPVPGSQDSHSPGLPRSAAPLPPAATSRKKDKSEKPPAPTSDETYEAVETEQGEYVAPMMHYQNM
ncbi:uncharacterized protein LOC124283036 [Haliotis rubra]|uniref:uncharacterized protein LOC124283036 n=1 Tax=Haliotis rubra TaxID=36100 RepID=UPI001EE5C104|nr:uncharacterized protein LOC124283036 [Haliotis rubra]